MTQGEADSSMSEESTLRVQRCNYLQLRKNFMGEKFMHLNLALKMDRFEYMERGEELHRLSHQHGLMLEVLHKTQKSQETTSLRRGLHVRLGVNFKCNQKCLSRKLRLVKLFSININLLAGFLIQLERNS